MVAIRMRILGSFISVFLFLLMIAQTRLADAQQFGADIVGLPLLRPGFAHDTTADFVGGQGNFFQGSRNFVDNRGFSLSTGSFFGAIAIDRSVTPNRVYVADPSNNRVLGWKSITTFNTHGGADIVFGQPDFFSTGCNGGIFEPTATTLCEPASVAVDSAGRLYIADTENNRVLEFDSPFTTDTIPDDVFGQFGSFTTSSCNQSGVSSATLCVPAGLAVDSANNLYVADSNNSRVLEYNTPETVTAVPGSGNVIADAVFGQFDNFNVALCNSLGTSANSLCSPQGVAVDSSKNVYIADWSNSRVLEYNTPLTTDRTADHVFGQNDVLTSNACNLTGINATGLCQPSAVVVDSAKNVYIADRGNNRVLEYNTPLTTNRTADRVFGQSTFAVGQCNAGFQTSSARLCSPNGLALDTSGNFYVADCGNNRVLEYITPLTTNTVADAVAGQLAFTVGSSNQLDSRGFDFAFFSGGVAIDRSVTPNRVYVADYNNNRVLAWSSVGAFVGHSAANLIFGQPNSVSTGCNTGGTSNKTLCFPRGVAVDSVGNLYVADTDNNRALEYDTPFAKDTAADRVFGQVGSFTNNFCTTSSTGLCFPARVAVDTAQNLYIADNDNNRVVEYNTPLTTDQTADKVFGQNNNFTTSSCNIGGISANSLCSPSGVAIDASGNVYVADTSNNRVLEYNTPLTTNTTADKVFGQAGSFFSSICNSGGESASSLCGPRDVAVDSAKNVYISDSSNQRMLEFNTPLTTNTVADKVFGQGGQLSQNNCKNTNADSLCIPDSIAIDSANDVFVVDADESRVLEYLIP